MALTIIPKIVGIRDVNAPDDTVAPTPDTVAPWIDFGGLEVEGRTFTVETEEVLIEDGEITQTKYMLNWEFFIQGRDALKGEYLNTPATTPLKRARVFVWGAIGTLGMAINDVYVWATPDYSGAKVRTKINMKKEFILYPNEASSPLETFTVTAT